MGSNNLETKNPGDIILADDPNQFKTALDGNVVPRDTDGIPGDLEGGLGTTLYRWATSYIQKIYLGVAANLVLIEESASALYIKINAVTKFKVDSTGFDGQYLKPLSAPLSGMTSAVRLKIVDYDTPGTQSWVVPDYCTVIAAKVVGGGGGGGGGYGGSASGGGGGGGGGGAFPHEPMFISVTPGETLTIVTGAGGTAGSAGAPATAGGNGGDSKILRSSTPLIIGPGAPGGAAGTIGTGIGVSPAQGAGGVAAGAGAFTIDRAGLAGGSSGGGGTVGSVGANAFGGSSSTRYNTTGGNPGGGISGGSGGGGGGAAGWGGNGGDGGQHTPAITPTAGQGYGAGGGGGNGCNNSGSGSAGQTNGGAGGGGFVRIVYQG